MIANITKNNRSAILVAILALFVVLAGTVVAFSDNTSAAVNTTGMTEVTSENIATVFDTPDENGFYLSENVEITTGVIDLQDNTLYLNGKTLTINGGTITNGIIDESDSVNMFWALSGTISDITFQNYNMAVVSNTTATAGANISITGCTFNASEGANAAIYVDMVGQIVNVSDCTFNNSDLYKEAVLSGQLSATASKISVTDSGEIGLNIFDSNTGNSSVTFGDADTSKSTNTIIDVDSDITKLVLKEYSGNAPTANFEVSKNIEDLSGEGIVTVEDDVTLHVQTASTSVTIPTDNSNVTVDTTVSDSSSINSVVDLNAELEKENVDVVVYTGTINGTVTVPSGKVLDVTGAGASNYTDGAAFVLAGEGSIVNVGAGDSKDFTVNNGTNGNSSVEVSNINGYNITLSYGSVVIGGNTLSGTITVTSGTFTLAADSDVDTTSSKTMLTINAASGTTVNLGDISVAAGGLTINNTGDGSAVNVTGGDINLAGDIKLDAVVNMTVGDITGTGKITVPAGSIFTYASKTTGVTVSGEGIIKIDGAQGTENVISSDQTFDGYRYLSQDTVIEAGVTVTIPRNATLNLMGFELTVYGNLVIERTGVVTTLNSNSDGSIVLMSGGSIQNDGIIGDVMPITISNGMVAASEPTQNVEMQGVNGVNLSIVRSGSGDDRVYNMYVSGDVSRVTGTDVHTLTIQNVGINADMTIGGNVEFEVKGTVAVSKDVTFTNNGQFMTIDSGASFKLMNGASMIINSPLKGTVSVSTGQIQSGDEFVNGTLVPASIEFDGSSTPAADGVLIEGVTGMTISVGRITVPNETDPTKSDVFQQMYVSGTLDYQTYTGNSNTEETLKITGTAYVDGALSIPKEIAVEGMFDVDGAGMVIANDGADISKIDYSGAMYVIETTVENAPVETTYYTTFAAAMEQIANAQDNLVTIAGEYDISGTYELTGEQVIEVGSNAEITIAEDGQITVGVDATIDRDAFYTIEGRVIVTEGVGYKPVSPTADNHYIYSVMTKDEDNTTTYSGFKLALDNATAGQTITVVGNADYDGNLVIPAQVTVEVNEGIQLTVLGNVTIEAEGELTLDNAATLKVGKDATKDYTVTVSGTLDATDGGSLAVNKAKNVNLYSTGTTTVPTAASLGDVVPNAAYYVDGDTVYTSIVNAVAYAEENALVAVGATGTFTETGAIESDDVDIVVYGKITMGSVTLNDASIYIATVGDTDEKASGAWYTADITGATGTDGSTATVSVYQTRATVASTSVLDATGASEYTLSFDIFDNNTEIVSGTVVFTGDSLNTDRDNVLTVASGATMLVTSNNVTVTGNGIANNGTIEIDNGSTMTVGTEDDTTATLTGNIVVGEGAALNVEDGKSLTITGTVSVDTEGDFTVGGTLYVGTAPELLGETTTGSIIGEVSLTGDVYVFAGASVAETEFTNGSNDEVKSTAYSINDIDFITVYTFDNNLTIDGTKGDVVYDAIDDLKDLYMPSTTTSGNISVYDIVWYSGETQIGNSDKIGDYAEVNTEIAYNSIYVIVSVGSHITLSVDGVVLGATTSYPLTIGTHQVSATVDPGYSGDVTITFNGVAVTNGQIEVTSDMLGSISNIVLSANGQLTQDQPVINIPGSSSGDEMGLTDYLLIILVILIVIMAIMVAFRLMRS